MAKKGDRVVLVYMQDPDPVPIGTKGTIDFVDDAGHIHVKWDNGRTLSLIDGIDAYDIVKENK